MHNKLCPFCSIDNPVLSSELSFAIYDRFPVNPGHMLIIPRRHVADFFDLTPEEKIDISDMLNRGKILLDKEREPDGYNIGVNCGESAGQTIFHVHIHLIPRYKGDIDEPRGGVRGVIPERRIY